MSLTENQHVPPGKFLNSLMLLFLKYVLLLVTLEQNLGSHTVHIDRFQQQWEIDPAYQVAVCTVTTYHDGHFLQII